LNKRARFGGDGACGGGTAAVSGRGELKQAELAHLFGFSLPLGRFALLGRLGQPIGAGTRESLLGETMLPTHSRRTAGIEAADEAIARSPPGI
jgi:hypothetical protein